MPLSEVASRNANTICASVYGFVLESTVMDAKAAFNVLLSFGMLVSVLPDMAFFAMAPMTCRWRSARPKSPFGSE